MRTYKVSSGSRFLDMGATCCHESVAIGDVILVIKLNDVSYNVENILLHRRCLEAKLTEAPEDRDPLGFVQLRKAMIEQGTPFPRRVPART